MKHTKEPWVYRPKELDDWGTVRGADGFFACRGSYLSGDILSLNDHRNAGTDPARPNSIRIVSCVNALTGIADPEAWVKGVWALVAATQEPIDHDLVHQALDDMKAAEGGE